MAKIRLLSRLQQQFVAAVLLPEETLKADLSVVRKKLSAAELGQIKRCYRTSMEGIVRRAQVCGIITRLTLSSFFFMQRMDWIGQ